jgi:acyl-CoA synthetase (AMP-forming)/AMP-acid ligase II
MFLLPDDSRFSSAPAIWASGEWWSYRRLWKGLEAVSTPLGSDRKKLAFVFCRNDLATVLAYLGAVEAGHAVALLDRALNPVLRTQLLEVYQPELIFGLGEGLDGYDALPFSTEGLHLDVQIREVHVSCPHEDLAVLLSTSGTTGSPKFVRLTRANVTDNAQAIAASLNIDASERALANLPLHYSFGMSVLNSHLAVGACVVLTDHSVLEPELWQVFRTESCTSFAGVPYSYQMLDRIGFLDRIPQTLRYMTQAGGKMSDVLVGKFHAALSSRGAGFFVMYGQTEASPRISCLPSDALPAKLGSAGKALAGGRLEIEVDGQLTTVPRVTGEVVYSGGNVMLGYAEQRTDLERCDDMLGVLRTGDNGFLDEDGCLFITGRSKRIAKVFGLRINLDEVEAMLRQHGPTAATAGNDKIVIHTEYGDADVFSGLRRSLAERLKLNLRAFEFKRLEALPLLASGKVNYRALEDA